jgi:tubulin polyglutamylase TTLL9
MLHSQERYAEAAQYNFFPLTFVVPSEYRMFVEEFKRSGGTWIMKPIGRAQGQGIFLFNKLSQVGTEDEWMVGWMDDGCMHACSTSQCSIKTAVSLRHDCRCVCHAAPQISDWRRGCSWRPEEDDTAPPPETYLAQRYVDAPYLVGGKKFDLRIYALVTNYSPLRVMLYRCGAWPAACTQCCKDDDDEKNAVHTWACLIVPPGQ